MRSTAHGGRLVSYDEREVPFDLAVVIPLHGGQAYVERSEGLGDALELRADRPGDAAVHSHGRTCSRSATPPRCPASKAGSVTHFEGEVLVENVRRFLAGEPLDATYDGHANCFIETGFGKAMLIDFNYEQEPVPGHYPAGVGLPLLKESRMNHLGKLMFQTFYWHSLLPGPGHPRHRLRHADRAASTCPNRTTTDGGPHAHHDRARHRRRDHRRRVLHRPRPVDRGHGARAGRGPRASTR